MSAGDALKRILPGTIGARFEKSAESFLRAQGIEPLQRNYRCRAGEIDLIMIDGDTIVFVEVRYRASTNFGDPLETITRAKQRKIARAASDFLAREPRYRNHPCRFDAIGITGAGRNVEYNWIKDAFST